MTTATKDASPVDKAVEEKTELKACVDERAGLMSQVEKLRDECVIVRENDARARARLDVVIDEVRQFEQRICANIEKRILNFEAIDYSQKYQKSIDVLKEEERGLSLLIDAVGGELNIRDDRICDLVRKLENSRNDFGRLIIKEVEKTAPSGIDDYFLRIHAAAWIFRNGSDLLFALSSGHKVDFTRTELEAAARELCREHGLSEL